MEYLFVSEDIVNPPYILATCSNLINTTKDKVWHKSSMNQELYLVLVLTQMYDEV